MTKKEIRQAVWKSLTERPKKWTEVVNRAIAVGFGGWVAVTAFINNNAGVLLLIIWTVLIGLVALYLTAKGR